MTPEKPRDDRTKVVGVRLSDEELADLPPAGSDAARVKNALVEWRKQRDGLDPTPGPQGTLEPVQTDILGRLDVLQAALEHRLAALIDGPDAFHRVALEADTRDIETMLSDVWAVCMETWKQTLNNHVTISLIREALVDGDGDPATLLAARRERVAQLLTPRYHDFDDRAAWMRAVTEDWRQMRIRERDGRHADAQEDGAAGAAAAE